MKYFWQNAFNRYSIKQNTRFVKIGFAFYRTKVALGYNLSLFNKKKIAKSESRALDSALTIFNISPA